MANKDEYVNFENALRELKLNEDQLKRLVSEGEIRAIRGENNSMKFRREEIERLKQDTGKTIQYTEESSDTLTDDLLFDESSDLAVDEEGMATAQISSDDTFVGDDTGMTTSPIKGKGKGPTKGGGKPPPAKSTKGMSAPKKGTPEPSAARSATSTVRRTTGRSTRIRQSQAEISASGIGMGVTAMLIIAFVVGAYSLLVWWDTSKDRVSSATEPVVNFAFEKFGKN